jgi:DASH complex subunit ASK1
MSGRVLRSGLPAYTTIASFVNPVQFWKQFFEASANVSLSGYEERNNEEETLQDPTATEDELSADMTQSTTLDETMSHETPSSQRLETPRGDEADDLDLTDLAISSHSTPRAPGQNQQADDDMTASSMEYSSSYETLRKQVYESAPPFDLPDSSTLPSTPGRQPFFPRGVSATTPMSSPFLPPASQPSTLDRRYQKTSDPVLHQMLDKTYRVQATPLGKGFRNVGGGTNTRSKFNITPKPAESTSKYRFDDSPISSPEPEAPKLHTEVFSSPIRGVDATPGTHRKRRTSSNRMRDIPRPGMSVLTPARKPAGKSAMWDSDDDLDYDDDDEIGPSPPKTMQFHIPQSRLMRTPGKPRCSLYILTSHWFMADFFSPL